MPHCGSDGPSRMMSLGAIYHCRNGAPTAIPRLFKFDSELSHPRGCVNVTRNLLNVRVTSCLPYLPMLINGPVGWTFRSTRPKHIQAHKAWT